MPDGRAPITCRTAISGARRKRRAAIKLATLTQELPKISSATTRNAPRNRTNPSWKSSSTPVVGLTRNVRWRLTSGNSSTNWPRIDSMSARACMISNPGARLAINSIHSSWRSSGSREAKSAIELGRKMSKGNPIKWPRKPFGATPIMVKDCPLRRISCPRTDSWPPN